jgi:predicted RNA binding protein YcfA (HicA-like mRNA interferase family)
MKVREVLRRLREEGWYLVKSRGGSHKQFKHPDKLGKVTVAGRESKDLPEDTRKSIFQQAGWED